MRVLEMEMSLVVSEMKRARKELRRTLYHLMLVRPFECRWDRSIEEFESVCLSKSSAESG